MRTAFRVDCSAGTYLPQCPECTWRGGVRTSRLAAQSAAERHAVEVHAVARANLARRPAAHK